MPAARSCGNPGICVSIRCGTVRERPGRCGRGTNSGLAPSSSNARAHVPVLGVQQRFRECLIKGRARSRPWLGAGVDVRVPSGLRPSRAESRPPDQKRDDMTKRGEVADKREQHQQGSANRSRVDPTRPWGEPVGQHPRDRTEAVGDTDVDHVAHARLDQATAPLPTGRPPRWAWFRRVRARTPRAILACRASVRRVRAARQAPMRAGTCRSPPPKARSESAHASAIARGRPGWRSAVEEVPRRSPGPTSRVPTR